MFRQHYEKMYNLARSILSDDDESNDVVSEVFTTILADDVVLMPGSEQGDGIQPSFEGDGLD